MQTPNMCQQAARKITNPRDQSLQVQCRKDPWLPSTGNQGWFFQPFLGIFEKVLWILLDHLSRWQIPVEISLQAWPGWASRQPIFQVEWFSMRDTATPGVCWRQVTSWHQLVVFHGNWDGPPCIDCEQNWQHLRNAMECHGPVVPVVPSSSSSNK